MSERRDKPGPPPGLTEEERREWWRRQRRKYVWEEGDIVIKWGDGKKPKKDDGDEAEGW